MTSWAIAHQAPLSVGFSRQEYWSGLPLPSPGDLPIPGIKPMSPDWQADSLPLSHLGSLKLALSTAYRTSSCGSDGEESSGDMGSTPGSGRSLEKEMETHSSIPAREIPWIKEPGRLQSTRSQSWKTERLTLSLSALCTVYTTAY